MLCRTLALGCPSLECQSCHLSAEEEVRYADLGDAELQNWEEWIG
jgi:hypothetical protein